MSSACCSAIVVRRSNGTGLPHVSVALASKCTRIDAVPTNAVSTRCAVTSTGSSLKVVTSPPGRKQNLRSQYPL